MASRHTVGEGFGRRGMRFLFDYLRYSGIIGIVYNMEEIAMFFRHRKEPELTLEQRILRLVSRRHAMMTARIGRELLEPSDEVIRRALTSLVEAELIETSNCQSEDTEFNFVVWTLASGLRKKVKDQRKARAKRILKNAVIT